MSPPSATKQPTQSLEELQAQVDYTVLSPTAYRALFGTLMMCCFLVGLDITIIVTAMPKIAAQFDSAAEISWLVTAFLLAQTAVSPLAGRLAEAFGRRNLIMFSMAVFTAFSLACGLATSFTQLAVFRAGQGLGGGLVMPVVILIISDITSMATRGVAMAPVMLIFTLSSIVGPLLGGALTDLYSDSWRICFYINIPIGCAALVVMWFCIPPTLGSHATKFDVQRSAAGVMSGSVKEAEEAARRAELQATQGHKAAEAEAPKPLDLDLVGSLACITFVTAFALAITWGGGSYSWSDSQVWALFIVAALSGVFFVYWEVAHAASPIIPFRLFAVRNVWSSVGIMFFGGFAMMGLIVYLPVYFQLVWGQTATQSGIALIRESGRRPFILPASATPTLPACALTHSLPPPPPVPLPALMLAFPFGSIGAGVAMAKTGRYYWQPLLGAAILMLGSGLATTFSPSTPFDRRAGYLIIAGLGLGMTIATPTASAQTAVLGRDRATTTTSVSFFGVLGRLVASAVGQTILNNSLHAAAGRIGPSYSPQQAYSDAIAPVFWLGVVGGGALILAGLWMQHIPLSNGHAAKAPGGEGEGGAAPAAAATALPVAQGSSAAEEEQAEGRGSVAVEEA